MEAATILAGHWLEILVAVYLLGMILYGHYRGFIRLAVSAAALLITLIGVKLVLPYVTEWVKNETPVYEMVQDSMEKAIGMDEFLTEDPEGPWQGNTEEETSAIESLELPGLLKEVLIENNTAEVYQKLGVELFHDYIGRYLAELVIQIVTFVLLFLVVYILLRILVVWLDLMAKLPILSGMNQIAGALLGGAEALIVIWLLCLFFTALSGTGAGRAVMEQIAASKWLLFLYQHNLLANLFIGLLSMVV